MKQQYWDDLAHTFEDEVFNVLENDERELIRQRIEECGSRRRTAVDMGCGTGRFLPVLADNFGRVFGVDFSAKCLKQARSAVAACDHVTLIRADVSRPVDDLPRCDFALSVNVLLAPSIKVRQRILNELARVVRPGGRLLLVVPALESAMLSNYRLIQWNLHTGTSANAAVKEGFSQAQAATVRRLRQGVVDAGGEPTKHYLREELEDRLRAHGFVDAAFSKLEYDWSTEFAAPPEWMQAPYPWDWLVLARRKKD